MRLLPRFRRSDPAEAELATRKSDLQKARSRRKIAAPLARLNPEAIPPDAIVFQRAPLESAYPPAVEQPAKGFEAPAEDTLDTPPDFLLKEQAVEDAAPITESPERAPDALAVLTPEADPKPAGDAPGDMFDNIFSEEKAESVDGSLASEVENVSIADLLADLSGISEDLGVPKRAPTVVQIHPEPVPSDDEPGEEAEPELKIEKIVPQSVTDGDVAIPLEDVVGLEEDIDIGSLLEPEPEPEPPAPVAEAEPSSPPPGKRGIDGSMMLHIFFLGLALTAAGAFGLTRISHPGPAGAEPTEDISRIVLAVVTTPHPTFSAIGTKAPTPSPSPSPTPAPTASPTPRVKDLRIPPAFQDYKVEYGDSLWSMAQYFGLCPDHILWANDRDEETPLIAGEYLTIPDGVGVIHKVRIGDTLISISRLYNADVGAIAAVAGNQVTTSADLVPGDEIFVPDGIPQSALDLGSKAQKMMSKPSSDGLVWPFYGPITTYYGEQRVGYLHNAIDIGGLGHYGASVNTIGEGRVAFVGNDDLYGQNVIVIHPDGSRSRYAHFSNVYVSQGESVSRGQALGALGCSGDSTGTHLHFELWREDEPADPVLYLP